MAAHIDVSGVLRVAAPSAEAFGFFTPEGERLWVPGWQPEYLYPSDGALVEGLTFRTHHGGELTIWLVSSCDVTTGAIDYVRLTPDSRVGTVTVRLAAVRAESGASGGVTSVTVAYRLTSLSAAGERTLDTFAAEFPALIASWERSIEAAITGSTFKV